MYFEMKSNRNHTSKHEMSKKIQYKTNQINLKLQVNH
jgi:hypothetical protein